MEGEIYKSAYAYIYSNEDTNGDIDRLVYQLRDSETHQPLPVPKAVCGVTDEERMSTLLGLSVSAQEAGYEVLDIVLAEEKENE